MNEASTSKAYKRYLVFLLMMILALGYAERMVFGVILQDLKAEFSLSDTQLGMLTGLAFTIFSSILGIPLARWADRGNRITIVSVTAALWAATMALCSLAGSFVHLLAIRIGTAASEAGVAPAANSLLPDYFPRDQRPRATARFYLGIPLGLMFGAFFGGWLNQLYGWRLTLLIFAIPGFILALLAKVTLRDPRPDPNARVAQASGDAVAHELIPSFKTVLTTLWASATVRHLMACFLIWYFAGWAISTWQAAFFIRSHGLATGELGTWLALGQVAMLLGTWVGGEWGSRYAAQNERLQLIAVALLFLSRGLFDVLIFLAPDKHWAFVALALAAFSAGAATGPMWASIQTLVPPRMRATAVVVVNLLPAFLGNGLGPLALGALSDALQPMAGVDALRYALMLFSPLYLWAAWHMWRAGRAVEKELKAGI